MRTQILALTCLLLAIPCSAEIITVNPNGTGDYPTIQAAIDAANDGDIIELQLGTYTGDGNHDIDFLGKAITVRSTNPEDPNIVAATTIDCENAGRGLYFHTNEKSSSVVAGLTIINGYASTGGAIFCASGSNPSIENCILKTNKAKWGAGMYIERSKVNIIRCTFYKNTSASYGKGGAIYICNNSDALLIDCEFKQNSIQTEGGAIYNKASNPTFINCSFISNTSSANLGGGIYNNSGSPKLVDCVFKGNSVRQDGAGMYTYRGHPELSRCRFENNNAPWDGGAIAIEGGSPEISGCLFYNNKANDEGGAIYCESGGYPKLTNCTLTKNTAKDYGAGLYYKYSSWKMTNCIFWGNSVGGTTDEQAQIKKGGGTGTQAVNYSCIQGWTGSLGGTGNIGGNPHFVDTDNGDFHLESSSPCVDSGNPSFIYDPYQLDMDRQPRVINGRIDMGYDEHDHSYAILGVSDFKFKFDAKQGMQNPPSQTLCLQNVGAGILSWQMEEDCDWLEAIPTNGVSSGQVNNVNLEVDISSLEPGIYNYQLAINSDEAYNSPLIVTVELKVQGPHIELSANQFEFIVQNGNLINEEQILTIVNTGGAFLKFLAIFDCDWLCLEPYQGEIHSGDYNEVVLSVDANSLSSGTHICKVTIYDPNAENNPQNFDVYLYVNPIQFAINAAENGDTVIIPPGIYKGKYNRNIDFKGKKITVQSTNPNCPTVVASTIIDCNGTEADPHRAFYFHSGEDANSILNGFTIKNGYSNDGGGIYCNSASPTITNCNFVDCSAEGWGGGIFCYKASPLISDCTFTGNSAFEGGAITTYSDWYYLCSPHIENCHIFDNTASGSGGGINSDCLSTPIISNCLITGNFAGTYGGGGISIFQSNPMIIGCTITDNSTDSSGGGILQWYEFENGSTITNCIIANNNAMHEGGGVLGGRNCDMTITNSAIFGNNGELGGGVFCGWIQSLTMRNCTITNNSEINVFLDLITGELKNNIIWSNTPHESLFVMGNIMVSYCDISGCGGSGGSWDTSLGSDGGGNIDVEPLFVDADGPDDTPGTEDDNLRLQADSACIDAGDNSVVTTATDLDGNPRIVNGTVDMGAYEFFYPNTAPVADAGDDQIVYLCRDGAAEIELDGSGSTDADGDELEYWWTWEIEGTVFDANGVSPIIELPVGLHTIELTVDDGVEESEPNSCVIEVIEGIEVDLRVMPRVINRKSRMRRILAVVQLPAGIDGDDIDGSFWLYPGEIEPLFHRLMTVNDSQKLFMVFDKSLLLAAVPGNGTVVLEIEAQLILGRCLYGLDRIRIIRQGQGPREQTGRRKGTRFRRNRVQNSR